MAVDIGGRGWKLLYVPFPLKATIRLVQNSVPTLYACWMGKKMKVESSIAAFTNENGVPFSRNKSIVYIKQKAKIPLSKHLTFSQWKNIGKISLQISYVFSKILKLPVQESKCSPGEITHVCVNKQHFIYSLFTFLQQDYHLLAMLIISGGFQLVENLLL